MTQALILEKRGGYEILTASDGIEAVQQAVTQQPDLILMDVEMPRMTGLEACRAIRAQEEIRAIPVIMVTTRSNPEQVASAFTSGCDDFVSKPIDSAILLEKIDKLINR